MNNKMGFLSGYWTLCILLTGFVASVKGQCDGLTQKFSDQNKEILSPNFNDGGEYNKSANCSWELSPRSDAKEYVLVLTLEKLRLYVVKSSRGHCLGSYNLSINEDQTPCLRYASTDIGTDKSSVFCNAFYSSSACANISQSQGCEKTLQTPYPVSVTYYSDGRTDPDFASANMYFKIDYEFIACPAVPTTTGSTIATTATTAATTAASTTTPATTTTTTATTATTMTTTASASLITIAATTTMQQTTYHTVQSDENETRTQMPSSNATRSNSIPNFTAESNTGSRQNIMVIIAASAGGGCLILIAAIAMIVFLRKRKNKFDISTGRRDQVLPMEERDKSNDSTGPNTTTMAGKPSQSNQSKPTKDATAGELYATVSKPPKDKKSPDSLEGHVTKKHDQSNQGQCDVTTPSPSEGFVYTTINIKKKNGREFAHSSKDMDEAE